MFREVSRKKQALSLAESIEILKEEPRGVLSVLGDDGYPYGLPMNHWYNPEDGHLYFHGSMKGHKADALKRCNKVSFCVYDQGFRREGEWALNIKSVIVFGRMQPITDLDRAVAMMRQFGRKFTSDTDYIERELREAADHTLFLELIPEHITGKITNES